MEKSELTFREHYRTLAERGNRHAIKHLERPVDPDPAFAHLVGWIRQLHGRSGGGMSGALPLSNREIEAWASLRGIVLGPGDADALIYLDGVLLDPDAEIR